jgi:hypothetical protein
MALVKAPGHGWCVCRVGSALVAAGVFSKVDDLCAMGSGAGVREIRSDGGQVTVAPAARETHGLVLKLAAELDGLVPRGMAGTGSGLGVGAGGVVVGRMVDGVGEGDGLVVGEGVTGGGVGAGAAAAGGAGSMTIGRPPLPLVPGGTGPGAEGWGMTPVR